MRQRMLLVRPMAKALYPTTKTTTRAAFLHSFEKSKKSPVRDTRLAGRVRFYKSVGVTSVSAPWEESLNKSSSSIESPISAGVDGTQSASGVSLDMPTRESLQELLTPRRHFSKQNNCNWFGVTLDGRTIKTPLGQTLAVPSQTLAWAIAAEWDAQAKTLQPAQMPLMTLVCTTLDQTTANPSMTQTQTLQYLPTDTTCYWADPAEDRVLYRKQEESWQGLHEYACAYLMGSTTTDNHALLPARAVGASEGLLMSRARKSKSSSGLPHPTEFVQAATKWVEGLDAWQLTAAHSVAAASKSFFISMAVVTSDITTTTNHPFANDLSKAVLAARVEEEFQIDNWGLVEGGHDYDRLNCSIQLHAAHFLTSAIASDTL